MMRSLRLALIVLTLSAATLAAQSTRMATDFEITHTEQQLAASQDFIGQLSGRLNLGDLRQTRNEAALARVEYERALLIATREQIASRRDSNLSRYAGATAYAGLAQAKLGRMQESFELMEEAVRYEAGNARIWNLYATAMSLLHKPGKAASAARNAVVLAEDALQRDGSVANRLDLAVYRHSLASALIDSGASREAERLLLDVSNELRSAAFAGLQRSIQRKESFEIYSSARGQEATYISLLNRTQLRLAAIDEERGAADEAREQYKRVLEGRTDDPLALAGLARLATTQPARQRYFQEAFDANPFSRELADDYQRYLARRESADAEDVDASPGSQMRLALRQIARGESRAATTLATLLSKFPDNDFLRQLKRETERDTSSIPSFLAAADSARHPSSNAMQPVTSITPAAAELRQLLALLGSDRLTAGQRARLDTITFVSIAIFEQSTTSRAPEGQSAFENGSIDGVPFHFSEPTLFRGLFATPSVRLTYRVLGASQQAGRDALLLEPLGLEAVP